MSRWLVDTSGWIEWLTGSRSGQKFAGAIVDVENLIVPVVVLYEVKRKLIAEGVDSDLATRVLAGMLNGQVVAVDEMLAFDAAQYAHDFKLPMADALIYSIARHHQATLLTQDAHFKGLPGVKWFAKDCCANSCTRN